jgi:hypothetical protein
MSIDPAAGTQGILGFVGTMLAGKDEAEMRIGGTGSPNADPLMSAATQQALRMMGQEPSQVVSAQGSPIGQAMAQYLNTHPLDRSDQDSYFARISGIIAKINAGQPLDTLERRNIEQISSTVGMSFDELIGSQTQYMAQQEQTLAMASQIAELNRQGQFDAAQQLATLMSDLPGVSATDLEDIRGQEKERYLRELNRSVDEASGDALRQANFANYNPGRVLGDLEEARIRGTQDADLASLEYALNALGGQQNLAISRGSLLQNYLGAPTQQAAQLAGIRSGGANVPTYTAMQQFEPSLFSQAYELSSNAMARQQQANTQSVSAASDMMSGVAGGMMG